MNDLELVKNAKAGSKDAFSDLMAKYEKRVYSFALRFLCSSDDAFDVAQETFLKVYSSLNNFKEECAFSTYLYRIMINCCNDFLKKRARYAAAPLYSENDDGEENEIQIADFTYSPENSFDKLLLKETIEKAAKILSRELRQAFVLRDINGLSYDEIAEILKIEEGTVKSRIFRAREKIKIYIIKDGNFSRQLKSKNTEGS